MAWYVSKYVGNTAFSIKSENLLKKVDMVFKQNFFYNLKYYVNVQCTFEVPFGAENLSQQAPFSQVLMHCSAHCKVQIWLNL